MTISARVRLKCPTIDTDGSTPAGGTPDSPYLCLTESPTFSGSEKKAVNLLCSEASADAWGNIVATYGSTGVITPGTVDLKVDWSIDTAAQSALVLAIERETTPRAYHFEFPESLEYSTGPKIVQTMVCIGSTPSMPILLAGEPRLTKTLKMQLSGHPTITPGVVRS